MFLRCAKWPSIEIPSILIVLPVNQSRWHFATKFCWLLQTGSFTVRVEQAVDHSCGSVNGFDTAFE